MLTFNWGVFWALLAVLVVWHYVSRWFPSRVAVTKSDFLSMLTNLESIDYRLEQISDSVSPIATKLATGK
jgi:hypothetical protein